MMNRKFIISIFFILLGYFTKGQNEINFPVNVKIDPLNYELSLLKIKKIEQISKHYFYIDSCELEDTSFSKFKLDYVFTYDTNFRLISFKYDFVNDISSYNPFQSKDLSIEFHNLESKLYKFSFNNETRTYNYYENEYVYNNGSLDLIKIHKPWSPRFGIIDGVYLKEKVTSQECSENTYINGLLVKKEIYFDGKLTWIYEFNYKTISLDGREIKLLENIIEKNKTKIITETIIKYYN